MKPRFTTDVRFGKGNTTLFLLASEKQSIVQARHRSIEEATPYLTAFGYIVVQMTQVKKFCQGYQHLLIMQPDRNGVLQAEPAGQSGITIGTTIVTEYEPDVGPQVFEPAHVDGRAAIIWTPPIDVKRQALAPVRYPTISFPGRADGSIDFGDVLKEWKHPQEEDPQPVARFCEGEKIYG